MCSLYTCSITLVFVKTIFYFSSNYYKLAYASLKIRILFGPLYTSTRYRHPTYPHQRPTANQLTNLHIHQHQRPIIKSNQIPHFHSHTPLALSPCSSSLHQRNHHTNWLLIFLSDSLLHIRTNKTRI